MRRVPLASVVMPYYNNEAHLRPALESYLAQSIEEIELILVDDGSHDASHDIVASFADDRILDVRLPMNVGISGAYNEGLEHTRASCVVFAGADDVAEADRIEALLDAADGYTEAVVASDVTVIDAAGRPTGDVYGFPTWVTPANVLIETLKRNYFLGASMAVVGHPELRLDPRLPAGDDFDVALRLLIAETPWVRVARPLVRYRVHGGNYSRSHSRMKHGAQAVLARYSASHLRDVLAARGHTAAEIDLALGIVALFVDRLDDAGELLCRDISPVGPPRLAFERLFYRGVVESRQGQRRESLSSFLAASEFEPDDLACTNNVAVLVALERHDRMTAGELLSRLVARAPGYIDARHNLERLTAGADDELRITDRILAPVLLHGVGYDVTPGERLER